jgi:hypothetical protein
VTKRTIDDLLKAIERLDDLQATLAKHDTLFGKILDKLEEMDRRLDLLERKPK